MSISPVAGAHGAAAADVILVGQAANDEFGASVSIGDVNRDSHKDLVGGASQFFTNSPGKACLFYGLDNAGFTPLPWGPSSSFLRVRPPPQRKPVQNSGGTASQCDGALTLDWNAFVATNPSALGHPFAAGQTVSAQGWFRDPPSPKSTMLSNAYEFVVFP